MATTKTRGGARPGAGRKKLGHAILYARMTEEAVNKVKIMAKEEGKTVGEYLQDTLDLR